MTPLFLRILITLAVLGIALGPVQGAWAAPGACPHAAAGAHPPAAPHGHDAGAHAHAAPGHAVAPAALHADDQGPRGEPSAPCMASTSPCCLGWLVTPAPGPQPAARAVEAWATRAPVLVAEVPTVDHPPPIRR